MWHATWWVANGRQPSGPVFCLLLGVSSDYAQPITGKVAEVTSPAIGHAHSLSLPEQETKWVLIRKSYVSPWWITTNDRHVTS